MGQKKRRRVEEKRRTGEKGIEGDKRERESRIRDGDKKRIMEEMKGKVR